MEGSPQPDRPRLTENDLIDQSIDLFADLESPVDSATARMIASQFHGGMSSQLYSLASSGHIGEDLLREIDRTYDEFKDQPAEQRKLGALAVYVADRMSRNDVEAKEGWSKLWLEAPDQSESLCPCCAEDISRNHRVGCPLGEDDEERLSRILDLQVEHGVAVVHWLAYAGYRTSEELEARAQQLPDYYLGHFPTVDEFRQQYEIDPSAYIDQLYHVAEDLDGSVHIFIR